MRPILRGGGAMTAAPVRHEQNNERFQIRISNYH